VIEAALAVAGSVQVEVVAYPLSVDACLELHGGLRTRGRDVWIETKAVPVDCDMSFWHVFLLWKGLARLFGWATRLQALVTG
jgi:hypothetical protein